MTESDVRGFRRFEFVDRYDKKCYIQDSSIATEDCIWLGVDRDMMHLTPSMAAALIPKLQRFIYTGTINKSYD